MLEVARQDAGGKESNDEDEFGKSVKNNMFGCRRISQVERRRVDESTENRVENTDNETDNRNRHTNGKL